MEESTNGNSNEDWCATHRRLTDTNASRTDPVQLLIHIPDEMEISGAWESEEGLGSDRDESLPPSILYSVFLSDRVELFSILKHLSLKTVCTH